MADTNIDALQEDRVEQARQATREAAVRTCLEILDRQPGDMRRAYREILTRLAAAIHKELEHEETPNGTVRPDDGSPD